MLGGQLFIYAMTILFLYLFLYASYRGSLSDYQRMEMIISTGLYVVIFGLIASIYIHTRTEYCYRIISICKLYYWTYTAVNTINTNEHGIFIYIITF